MYPISPSVSVTLCGVLIAISYQSNRLRVCRV